MLRDAAVVIPPAHGKAELRSQALNEADRSSNTAGPAVTLTVTGPEIGWRGDGEARGGSLKRFTALHGK